MIQKTQILVEVKKTEDEDIEFWQGFDKNGHEVEYYSKNLHIKKKVDETGQITDMEINGSLADVISYKYNQKKTRSEREEELDKQ